MAFGTERQIYAGSAASQAVFDEGLRAYMLRVYNYMASGLALTGFVAAWVASASITTGPGGQMLMTDFGQMLFTGGMRWVVMLAPLAFILVLSFGLHKMSYATLQIVFFRALVALVLCLAQLRWEGVSPRGTHQGLLLARGAPGPTATQAKAEASRVAARPAGAGAQPALPAPRTPGWRCPEDPAGLPRRSRYPGGIVNRKS